ncbi:hypothetical protein, partial [uncultured Muribaculum sp.]|uniref:hypothetical protein n=1 Tax=uncultured Muribaculum sp. TaxID=1918613 RepID=UPI0025B6E266
NVIVSQQYRSMKVSRQDMSLPELKTGIAHSSGIVADSFRANNLCVPPSNGRQKLTDALPLAMLKLYFHEANNLCY